MSVILLTILIISDFIGALQSRTHVSIDGGRKMANKTTMTTEKNVNRSIEIIQQKSSLFASRLHSLFALSFRTVDVLISSTFGYSISFLENRCAATATATAVDEVEEARKCQFHVSLRPKHEPSMCTYEC